MASDILNPQPGNEREALLTGDNPNQAGLLVRELPAPADLASEIEAVCGRRGFVRGQWRDWVVDELKLQYHYGGKTVAVIQTDRGLMVLAAGDSLDSPEIAGLRASLTPEENERTVLETFPRRDDDSSRL